MKATTLALLICSATEAGCASAPKLVPMDANRPIETEHGYQQDGKDLDPTSMREQLRKEPRSAPGIERASTLGTLATVLAVVGGGLVGYPLGQKAAGNPDPLWGLAYAGGGAIVLSIPMVVWAVSSFESAVEAHNERFQIDRSDSVDGQE